MKIVHLSTYVDRGGAAVACYRLHKALRKKGHNSVILALEKGLFNEPGIKEIADTTFKKRVSLIRLAIEKLKFKFLERKPEYRFMFTLAMNGVNVTSNKDIAEADIIHIHWVHNAYLSLKTLATIIKMGKPIFWTLHDMWAFTGGCHISYECKNFKEKCGNCFYLKKPTKNDYSRKMWNKKYELFKDAAINVVSVSSWLSSLAKSSSLLKQMNHSIIPNPIDIDVFKPAPQKDVESFRHSIGIKKHERIILFGSPKINDPVKGFPFFAQALQILKRKKKFTQENIHVLLFGKLKTDKEAFYSALDHNVIYLGEIFEIKKLVQIYSAADITVVSSLFETFGQVITESMACGTPVVTFNNSGPKDIISHNEDGYLASYKSPDDLAQGIIQLLFDENREEVKTKARRKVVDVFPSESIAEKYIEIYNDALHNKTIHNE